MIQQALMLFKRSITVSKPQIEHMNNLASMVVTFAFKLLLIWEKQEDT